MADAVKSAPRSECHHSLSVDEHDLAQSFRASVANANPRHRAAIRHVNGRGPDVDDGGRRRAADEIANRERSEETRRFHDVTIVLGAAAARSADAGTVRWKCTK